MWSRFGRQTYEHGRHQTFSALSILFSSLLLGVRRNHNSVCHKLSGNSRGDESYGLALWGLGRPDILYPRRFIHLLPSVQNQKRIFPLGCSANYIVILGAGSHKPVGSNTQYNSCKSINQGVPPGTRTMILMSTNDS